jgi:hypothetical protein
MFQTRRKKSANSKAKKLSNTLAHISAVVEKVSDGMYVPSKSRGIFILSGRKLGYPASLQSNIFTQHNTSDLQHSCTHSTFTS